MGVHIPFLPSTYPHKFTQHKWKNRTSRTQHSLILWWPQSAKNLSDFHRRLQQSPSQTEHGRRSRGSRYWWGNTPPRRRQKPPARLRPLWSERLQNLPRWVEGWEGRRRRERLLRWRRSRWSHTTVRQSDGNSGNGMLASSCQMRSC